MFTNSESPMKPAFLLWLKSTIKRDERVKRQYEYNRPKGIV